MSCNHCVMNGLQLFQNKRDFPGGSVAKNLPSKQETGVQAPGKMPWGRKWQHIPVFLPGKSHGQRRLMGYIKFMGWQKSRTRLSN